MKKIFLALGAFTITLSLATLYFYNIIYKNQALKETKIYISSNDDINSVVKKLEPTNINLEKLNTVITLKKFSNIKPGMYVIKKGMNSNQVVNLLRSGNQTPVKVTFNNQNYIENLCGRLSKQIEADSLSILNSLTDLNFLKKEGFNKSTALHYCMPYTYDCYWNISPSQLRNKFLKTYKRFWNKQRTIKAKKLNLTKDEVIALASIVQSETQHKPERKRVAGVYLNRVRKGMLLQADPTANYAWKEKYGRNVIIKRTLNKHLKLKSPYNTYTTKGIPPSAISMPDVDAIDAVLNAERHSYYYFCANPNKIGTHSFAKTLRQHNRNAAIYQRWYRNTFSKK